LWSIAAASVAAEFPPTGIGDADVSDATAPTLHPYMIRTTLLIYLLFLLFSLTSLRYLYLHTLERKNASARQRGLFVRRSAALLAAFHVFYFAAAGFTWGLKAIIS
jgi:hypothetical protein